MARTTSKARATSTAPAKAFSFADVEVGVAEALPKGVHLSEPNPLEEHVRNALDQDPRYIPVPNGAAARQAENYLRRAGKDNGWGVQVRFTDAEDNSLAGDVAKDDNRDELTHVYFVAKSERKTRVYKERRYTNDDIRAFHKLGDKDKITKEHRQEFREANGFNERSDR